MPLQEVVILNPRGKAKRRKAASRTRKTSTKRKSAARRSKTGGTKMARRKTTRRRKAPARRRKATTRRRAPARRRKTTRRRRTTKRRAAPKRRKTTRRRRTVKRRAAPKRRKTTRRRRRAAPKRRRVTRRRKTTRRKPARRRKTTRRRRPARRRKTTRRRRRSTARRRPARRRKSTARRRSTARRGKLLSMKKMSFGNLRKFVRNSFAARTVAIAAVGLALPATAMWVAAKTNLGSMLAKVPVLGTVMGNAYGRAALGALLVSGVAYGIQGTGLLTTNESMMAAGVGYAVLLLNAMRQSGHLPGMMANAVSTSVDDSALFGYGGSYMNGYGGYLGYLGNVEEDDLGEAPQELFGYSAAPAVNVF